MSAKNTDDLKENISQLLKLDEATLAKVVYEIQNSDIPFGKAYNEYQSGGWYTAALFNQSGSSESREVEDGKAIPTEIMSRLAETMKLLDDLGLSFFAVRLAKTEGRAYLWEHKDYIELNESEKIRLHIPLTTNYKANITIGNHKIHMKDGYLWKLDPTTNHGISNDSQQSRTHLILDCYMTDKLRKLIKSESLDAQFVRRLPVMAPQNKKDLFKRANQKLSSEGVKSAEESLLKTFHIYDLKEKTSYDLLIDFYKTIDFSMREKYWVKESIKRTLARDKLKGKPNALSQSFLKVSNRKQQLPQFGLLDETLKVCSGIKGLEEAYVRGSLARGDADVHSDVDLLCVVSPEHFESFVKNTKKAIESKNPNAFPGWVDNIVKDFGGVGYVYLIEHEGELRQLDVYIACQGHPSLDRLNKLKDKQKVFVSGASTAKADKIEASELIEKSFYLHKEEIAELISRENNVKDSPERSLIELCAMGVMINKCLNRDNTVLAAHEFDAWQKEFVKLIRYKLDPEKVDYGFYHLDHLKAQANDNGRLYEMLVTMRKDQLTNQKFEKHHKYMITLVKQNYPDLYKKYKPAIQAVSSKIAQNTERTMNRDCKRLKQRKLK